MKQALGLLGGLCLVSSIAAHAGELVYRPINPSFGGNPMNGSHLLGKAQAHDTHENPDRPSFQRKTATERLVSRLESRLISQLISDVGSGDMSQGSFESDDFAVIVDDTDGELSLHVTDKATGDVTSISVGGLNFNP